MAKPKTKMSRQSAPPSINSCERIRPERPRNAIQRLVWGPGSQFQVGHFGIPEDEGSNPRMALRRYVDFTVPGNYSTTRIDIESSPSSRHS